MIPEILFWVLASVCVGVAAGFLIGRNVRTPDFSKEEKEILEQRDTTLRSLLEILHSVENLTSDVNQSGSEMDRVRKHVGGMQVTGEMEQVRSALLGQISAVLNSNQKLEDDLEFARCRMQEQAEELDRTRIEAHTDSLTGTNNRKSFDDKLRLLLHMFRREKESFVLVLADIDHFKWINDTHGHSAGDLVLKRMGELLHAVVGDGDFIARYGGDEFALLLPKVALSDGMTIAEKLRDDVNHGNFGISAGQGETAITLSLGVAEVRSGDTIESLFQRADEALYASKRGGRNRVHREKEASGEEQQPSMPSSKDSSAAPENDLLGQDEENSANDWEVPLEQS